MADHVPTLALMRVILSRCCLFNVLKAQINWFSADLGNGAGEMKGTVSVSRDFPSEMLGRAARALG